MCVHYRVPSIVVNGYPPLSRAGELFRARGAHIPAANHTPNRRSGSVDIGGSPRYGSQSQPSAQEEDEVIFPMGAASGPPRLRIRVPEGEDAQGYLSV
jgi:hypothetical protein